ncbi:ABC transporter ATP-binding protein, partial [Pediococcus pentosaceus]
VTALIGPNGAGKTTLIKCIMGLNQEYEGSIVYQTNKISYCPDTPFFDTNLTAIEVMQQSAALSSQNYELHSARKLLKMVGLDEARDRFINGFSRGMLQRLGIAASLILDPEVLILDEPTSALDPAGQRDILKLIKTISKDRAVIVSSHNLKDMEQIADNLIVLNEGKLVYAGNLRDFIDLESIESVLKCSTSENLNRLTILLRPNVPIRISNDTNTIYFPQNDFQKVFMLCSQHTDLITSISKTNYSLSAAFETSVNKEVQ